jgi:hypothetical protein
MSIPSASRLGGLVAHPGGPSQAQLDAITNALDSANSLYNQRRYQDAIVAYQTVGNLVYALLVPGWPIGVSPLPSSLDSKLFLPLLSASAEWLNVINPNPPDPAVRGRIAPDPAVIGPSATFGAQLGVRTAQLASPASRNAAADLALAHRFAAQGDTTAANFFLRRSVATDATAAKALLPAARATTALHAAVEAPPAHSAVRVTPAASAPASAAAPTSAITVDMLAAPDLVLKAAANSDRTVGVVVQGKAVQFAWKGGDAPPVQNIADQYYGARTRATSLVDLVPAIANSSDVALNLPHIYYYVVPLGPGRVLPRAWRLFGGASRLSAGCTVSVP